MSTVSSLQYLFNGVVDTKRTVMSNLQSLCSAAGCWLTFDVNTGKWSIIINQAGTSTASFDDSNILGGINISGTGITELYNKVRVQFPHRDLDDQTDWVSLEIPNQDRFPNEHNNTLEMSFNIINDPILAETIGITELKQSRVDKIIQFRTDFSKLGLKAGDLIDVTSEMYGFDNKMFRIVTISEEDGNDNNIILSITALEYDAQVYDYSNLNYYIRQRANSIIPEDTNQAIKASNNEAGLPMDLSGVAKALGLFLVFNSLTGRWELSQGGQQTVIAGDSAIITWTFDDGNDLDIRCRMYSPDMGQNTIDQVLGWTGGTNDTVVWPPTGIPVLVWGGDNTGVGEETVYVNIARLRELYPTQQYFIVECYANWYGTAGIRPVKLNATLYQGGTISQSGFSFVNSGYTRGRSIDGITTFIDSVSQAPNTLGNLMGYFIFDAANNTAQFRNDLTGF